MNLNTGTRVLLISNSTLYRSSYLDHAEAEIRDFLGNVRKVLFVPFALYDRDAYASMARQRFYQMGPVRAENGSHVLKGSLGARIFRKGHEPVETKPGEKLDHLFG